jgi:hypothetical protein
MPNEQIPEDQEQEDKEIKRRRFFDLLFYYFHM